MQIKDLPVTIESEKSAAIGAIEIAIRDSSLIVHAFRPCTLCTGRDYFLPVLAGQEVIDLSSARAQDFIKMAATYGGLIASVTATYATDNMEKERTRQQWALCRARKPVMGPLLHGFAWREDLLE